MFMATLRFPYGRSDPVLLLCNNIRPNVVFCDWKNTSWLAITYPRLCHMVSQGCTWTKYTRLLSALFYLLIDLNEILWELILLFCGFYRCLNAGELLIDVFL